MIFLSYQGPCHVVVWDWMRHDGPDGDNLKTNGIIIEFFVNCFEIDKEDSHLMIKEAMNGGRLQPRMMKGLVTVGHK